MTSSPFTKMSGTGNSFIIVDSRTYEAKSKITAHFQVSRPELARQLCQGSRGSLADGLIFIEEPRSDSNTFAWDFYNADGSKAEMCGNASRCVALYYQAKVSTRTAALKFETLAGVVEARIHSQSKVEVIMPAFKQLRSDLNLSVEGYSRTFSLVDSGVPHLVAEIPEANLTELIQEARLYRKHEELGPKGANVTYFVRQGENKIQAYSYERGVEDFTLSCGTGAVAAALVAMPHTREAEVSVSVRGGELRVGFDHLLKRPTLIGEARFLCDLIYY